jgi:DNA polymerase III epsilon subunit-like protein
MLPPIHVIDFEGNRAYGILEYALVTLENGALGDIHHANCSGRGASAALHFREHSRFADGAGQLSFGEHLPLFRAKRAHGFFCAHNAAVEERLLRHHSFCPGMVRGSGGENVAAATPLAKRMADVGQWQGTWGPWIDTCKLYRKFYPSARRYGLGELVRHFRLEERLERLALELGGEGLSFHRALYDALGAALLLLKFIELFSVDDVQFLLPD